MIGEKCQGCGDEVLILKDLKGRKICLDCYYKYKDNKAFHPEKFLNNGVKNQFADDSHQLQTKHRGDRRCPNCGRIIPFDSIVCPYCGKKFESYL